jgi:hypothetical protein
MNIARTTPRRDTARSGGRSGSAQCQLHYRAFAATALSVPRCLRHRDGVSTARLGTLALAVTDFT